MSNVEPSRIVDLIFQTFPKSKIWGKYVTHHLKNTTPLCRDLDVVFGSHLKSDINEDQLSRDISSLIISFQKLLLNKYFDQITKMNVKKWQYSPQNLIIMRLIIEFEDLYPELTINFSNGSFPPYSGCFLSTSLIMNAKGEIGTWIQNSKELQSLLSDDLTKRHLNLVMRSRIQDTYLKRISYIKLARDSIDLIDRGWNPPEKFRNFGFSVYDQPTAVDCCGICLSSLIDGYSIKLDCDHVFHLNCLEEQMMNIGASYNQCSICRKDLVI